MSQNFRTLVVAAVVITLGLLVLNRMLPRSVAQIPNAVQIDQWEYKVDADVLGPTPNRLGKEGWELVTVWVQGEVAVRAIYKRPLR
jgi:hypothetical protein